MATLEKQPEQSKADESPDISNYLINILIQSRLEGRLRDNNNNNDITRDEIDTLKDTFNIPNRNAQVKNPFYNKNENASKKTVQLGYLLSQIKTKIQKIDVNNDEVFYNFINSMKPEIRAEAYDQLRNIINQDIDNSHLQQKDAQILKSSLSNILYEDLIKGRGSDEPLNESEILNIRNRIQETLDEFDTEGETEAFRQPKEKRKKHYPIHPWINQEDHPQM